MFPELTRDDVFRLETRRLWLRWPEVADADAVTTFASHKDVAEMTAHIPHPYPKTEAAKRIDGWRSKNGSGLGLKLLLTQTGDDRQPIGLIGLDPIPTGLSLGFVLSPTHAGQGLATEAAQAMIDTAFMLSSVTALEASCRVINSAARRVLEKSGFAYEGTALQHAPAREGMISSDRFRLSRRTWVSLKQWRMPRLEPRPQAVLVPAMPDIDRV
ncbi:GNAT family N-acetyltransferase [Lichenihabitans psoromatis]|uniref:GNAT family N-acetyltransferase n=1 Tax=Lichenihabitans psoromatis TaxID=2528642 RepID=UPI001AED1012|nr:GNAT family N-acetyltransferase [Lichenihabitans psoromatis]